MRGIESVCVCACVRAHARACVRVCVVMSEWVGVEKEVAEEKVEVKTKGQKSNR